MSFTNESKDGAKPCSTQAPSYPAEKPQQDQCPTQPTPVHSPPPYTAQNYPPQPSNPPHGYPGSNQQVYYPPAVSMGQLPVAVFDQGARFNPNLGVSIPPPPPGVAPTAAQMAVQHGQSVVVMQQDKDLFGGGSDGGYTVF